jgi:hypothetical protein
VPPPHLLVSKVPQSITEDIQSRDTVVTVGTLAWPVALAHGGALRRLRLGTHPLVSDARLAHGLMSLTARSPHPSGLCTFLTG